MAVTFFRKRVRGPEILVEDKVADQIPSLFATNDYPLWTGGSLPIGAGRPDLLVVSCAPKVYGLAQAEMSTAQILGYLRAVGRARFETIVERVGVPKKIVARCLEDLLEAEAVSDTSDVYQVSPDWRNILPEIVTIEVKISDWRKAVAQAARNRIFVHKSFIALPEQVAMRIICEPILSKLGIGVLAVGKDDAVRILKPARHFKPRVWSYYYQLAHIIANHSKGVKNAVCCTSAKGPGRLS